MARMSTNHGREKINYLKKTTWKGTTYGPEEYPWPGPEALRV